MKTKSLMLVVLFIINSNFSYGQEFYHGIGGQIDYGLFNLEYNSANSNFSELSTPYVPGVFYKATLALTDQLAVSAYPFLGISGSVNSRSGSSLSIGVQIPVVAELYLGDIDDRNFFVGAGLSFASLGDSEYGSGKAFGPQLSIGGQFYVANNQLIGVRLAYTHGLNKTPNISEVDEVIKDTHGVISLGAFYMFE